TLRTIATHLDLDSTRQDGFYSEELLDLFDAVGPREKNKSFYNNESTDGQISLFLRDLSSDTSKSRIVPGKVHINKCESRQVESYIRS
ncbi:941_t:CDS:2, partial [Acaulospora morrowiae]